MGGCASRPKEFDSAAAPEPAETPETTEKVVAPREGVEVEKEAPLVDLSEPAEAAPGGEVEKEAPLVDISETAEAAPAAAEEGEKKEEEKKVETNKAEGETPAPSS